jgi:SepF-like predicted cell division protein (DUF552 family)
LLNPNGGTVAINKVVSGAGPFTYALDVSGNLSVGGSVTATSYNISSDYRIKTNIKPLDETFSVDKLNPITYLNLKTEKEDIGLIAHELQEVYPFLVNGRKDGETIQSVNYNGLIGILIKEIQDLKEKQKSQNNSIKELSDTIREMRSEINELKYKKDN